MPLMSYEALTPALMKMQPESDDWGAVVQELARIWTSRYPSSVLGDWNPQSRTGSRIAPSLVWVSLDEFGMFDDEGITYLFDKAAERLVGAYVVTSGKNPVSRKDREVANRHNGQPIPDWPGLIRGHTIAHSLGGGSDINIVPQDKTVNGTGGRISDTGFRHLEELALENPGALYFVHWLYDGASGGEQVPTSVEQGLLHPRSAPRVYRFAN